MNKYKRLIAAEKTFSTANPTRKWVSGAMLLGVLLQSNATYAQGLPSAGSATNGSALQAVKEVSVSPKQASAFTPTVTATRPGVNLDLGSTAASVLLAPRLFNGVPNVLINVGGADKLLSPGQLVTPGEFIAAKQILSGAMQSLSLTTNGSASGGSFSFSQIVGTRISQIVIPENVSALNLTGNTSLARTGAINNYGSIFVAPNSPLSNNAVLAGSSISNFGTALITSNLTGGAFASSASSGPVNLVLQALSGITNYGTISSSGSLAMSTVTGGISNLTGSSGQTPVISAVNDITMSAGNGNIVNAGLVQSLAGNINMVTPNPMTNLNITGTLGTFIANAGAINIRDLTYAAGANINMLGGDYISKALNIYAGNGQLTGDVGEVSGALHTYGNYAHFTASTAVLNIGDSCITGDPLYVNTGGSINVVGKLDVTASAEPLTLVAIGDITGDATAQLVNNGGDITLIAGADISSYSGSSQFPTKADGTVTINDISKNSTSGGKIDFSASTAVPVVDASSGSSKGGNVTLVALSNTAGTSGGQVLMPASSVSIDTSSTAGKGGDVLVLANSQTTTENVIQLGPVLTGSVTQGGSVGIYAQTPAAGSVGVNQTGAITGTITNSGTGPATAKVVLGDVATAGGGGAMSAALGSGGAGGNAGAIHIEGGEVSAASLLAYGGGGGGGGMLLVIGGPANNGGNGGNGNDITVLASSSLSVSGDVNSSGGGGGGAGFGINSETGGAGGTAGAIKLVSSGGTLTVGGNIYATHGGQGGTGGPLFDPSGGGGGGSHGGAGGGGAGGGAGNGGGGGGGYTNYTNMVESPSYYFAAGGGGAGGGGGDGTGGAGGGFFGAGAGGNSTALAANFGVAGNKNVYMVTSTGIGGKGGGASPGQGGIFYAIDPFVASLIPPNLFDGANLNTYGGASGLGGKNDAQSVGPAAGAGGNIHVDGGNVSIACNPTPDPTTFFYKYTSTNAGNNILIVSRDYGGGGDFEYSTKATFTYWLATGSDLSFVSTGQITPPTKVALGTAFNSIDAPGTNVTLLSGMNVTGIPGSNVTVDLSSGSTTGGSFPEIAINTYSDSADGGNVTMVARSGALGNGNLLSQLIATAGNNGGDVLLMTNGSNVVSQFIITAGKMQSGKIEVYGREPEGILNFAPNGSSTGSILKTGALTATSIAASASSSGFGGVSIAGQNATNGGNAGDITIQTAGDLTVNNALALGGGGGGGYGSIAAGFDGGNGGDGGNIVLEGGLITIAGFSILSFGTDVSVNSSGGGGGGGGGGGELQTGGQGGSGGKAGSVSLTASSKLVFGSSILAADGADGGDGSIGTAGQQAGSGGGGGGGYGGGGGGGGGAVLTGAPNGVGGGGGGSLLIQGTSAPSGGGGGGGNTGLPSGGGSGGGSRTAFTMTNYQLKGSLLISGSGGNSGGDLSPGTAGAAGDDSSGGQGGKYASSPTNGGTGGLNLTEVGYLNNGGGGGGNGDLSIVPAGDGAGPSILASANNTISITSPFLAGFTFLSLDGMYGKDISINQDSLTFIDIPLFAFPMIGTNSVTVNSKDGGPFLPQIQTPDLKVNITGGSFPILSFLGLPLLTGINGAPAHITIDSAVDVLIFVDGDIVIENSKAPNLLLNEFAPSSGSLTIAAAAQITAGSINLASGTGGTRQTDPLNLPGIHASNITLSSEGSISLAVTSAALTTVTADADGDLELQAVGPLKVGDLTAGTSGSGNSIIVTTLPDINGNGSITVAAGNTLTADNVNLFASSTGTGTSVITQEDPLSTGSIVAKSIVLTNSGDSTSQAARNISISVAPTTTASLAVDTDADAVISSVTPEILQFSANQALNSLILNTSAQLDIDSVVLATGEIKIAAAALNNSGAIQGSNVDISALAGLSLSISNSGSIKASQGNLTVNSAPGKNIVVDGADGIWQVPTGGLSKILFNVNAVDNSSTNFATFNNDQTLVGPTIMTAQFPAQSIQVTDGTLVQGNELVWLKTPNYIQTGAGTGMIIGNPLVIGVAGQAGTIANSIGNVLLPANFTFIGQDLSIIAQGSIISTGLSSINLAGTFGGSLTMIAGFNFTPPTPGQVGPNSTTYTIGTPSTGGSINLPGVSINLTGTGGPTGSAGGNLLAVAHGGSITLGPVNTNSATGLGGSVTIIGQNGVNVGAINSTGTVPGPVQISAADSQTNGSTVISGGTLVSGSFSPVAGTFNNNIVISNINAGTTAVTISTGGTGSITSPPGTSISAGTLIMTAGTGGIGTPGANIASSAAILSANSIGDVFLSSTAAALSLGASSGNKFQLTSSSASSQVNIDGALSANDIVLKSSKQGSFVLNAPLGALNGGQSNSVIINSNGTGSISDAYQQLGTATISSVLLQLTSGTGSIGSAGLSIQTDASTLSASTGNITADKGVFINNLNTSPVTITGLSSGSSNSSIVYDGQASTLSVSGQVSGNSIQITNQGSINLNNKVTGAGAVDVQASGSLSTSSPIIGKGINLTTAPGSAGSITLGGPLTSSDTVAVLSDGNITTSSTIVGTDIDLTNTGSSGSINIGATINGSGQLSITAMGNLSTSSTLKGADTLLVTQSGTSGNILIGGTVNATGKVSLMSDNNIVTTGSITGTDIDITNTGLSGSVNLGGALTGTGAITVLSNGNLSASSNMTGAGISLTTSSGSSGSIILGGTLNSSVGVDIASDNSITTSGSITSSFATNIKNTGPSGTTTIGGTINASLVDIDSKGTLTVNSPVTANSGSANLKAFGNLNLNASVTGNDVILSTLPGSNGNISLGANITATNSVFPTPAGITVFADGVGSITQSTGILSSSSTPIHLGSNSGSIGSSSNSIAFNGPEVSAATSGNVFLLSQAASTVVDSSSGNSFNLSSTGDVTIGGSSGGLAASFINISTLGNGNITLAKSINGIGGGASNAISVTLSLSGTGSLSASGSIPISTNSLILSAVTGDFGSSGPGQAIFTNAKNLTVNTQGNAYIDDSNAGSTNLLSSTANDFTLSASNINIGANSTFSGSTTFNTSIFSNPVGTTLTGGSININGLPASSLTIKNGGTLVANTSNIVITADTDGDLFIGNAGGPTPGAMQVTGPGSPTITLTAPGSSAASSNDVIFTGNQNFFGDTIIDASTGLDQVVQVNTGVTIQGFQSVTVFSNDLILQGTLIGNPLIFNSPSGAGTIANSQGDVLLSSDLIFNGQSLAILASGNVLVTNPSGILIDLSNNSSSVNLGRGGDLNVVAGFNFTPATGGQVGPSGAVYAIANNPSTSGGSIDLSKATILTGTSVDAANSGNVLAAAHGGVLNTGAIKLGSVNTSNSGAGGSGGSINIIAQGGVTLGAINTTGDFDGTVTVYSATPEIIGVISDQNGNFAGNGFIQPAATTFNGDIVLNSINAGQALIQATTGASGSITLADGANIIASQVQLTSGSTGGVQIGDVVLVKTDTLSITAGSLGIAQTTSDALLDSPVAEFGSAGQIGAPNLSLNITATLLTANSSAGSVYLYNTATTDITLINGLNFINGAADTFSLLAENPGGTKTLTFPGAMISAPHVEVTSLNGSIDVAVDSSIANSIKFQAPNGNIALSSSTLGVIPDANGNGGSIQLDAATLTYANSGLSALTLNANATGTGNGGSITYLITDVAPLTIGSAAGNLKINATGGSAGSSSGNGGSASISTGGNLVFDPTQLNIVPLGNNGNGGNLSLTAGSKIPTATLTINTNSITENGVGIGNGGSVNLISPVVSYQNSGTLPLTITANGGSNGNGGSIFYSSTNTAALSIGGGSNSLNLSATSGTTGGNGGSVQVFTGGAMTVSPLNLAVGPLGAVGNGGTMNLYAGAVQANSPLAITGSLSANAKGAAVGGTISLRSDSSSPFVILQKTQPTNGVFGVITAQGNAGNGTISVINNGGGVTLSAQQFVNGKSQNPAMINVASVQLIAGAGDLIVNSSIGRSTTNTIVLAASGNITKPAGAILTSNNMNLQATTGNIGTTSPFKVTSNNLSVNAGAIVNVANTSKSLTITSSNAGASSTFTLTNTGAITTTGDITAGSVKMSSGANGSIAIGGNITALAATGNVNLTASGTGSIFNQFASGTDRITGSSILLKSSTGSIGTIGTSPVALRVNSGAITPTTSGGVNINNSSTADLTIAGSLSRQQFLLTTQGNLTISKPITSAKQITLSTPTASNGNIAINANLGGGATTSIIVSAGGSGNISTSTKSITLAATQSITLSSGTGNIGTGTTTATAITTRTPLISATTGGTGVVNLNNNRAATLAASSAGGSFTLTNSTNLSVGSINTANGDINIVATSGLLQTIPGATITANNGAILFNNKSTSGKILIANNSTVQTQGIGGGSVQIGIGTTPFAQATPATSPTNVNTSKSGGGQIFFGTNGITGPAAGTPAQVNAIGKNVVFSTATAKATAITLGNGAVITADPPVTDAAVIHTYYSGLPLEAAQGANVQTTTSSSVFEGAASNVIDISAPTGSTTIVTPVSASSNFALPLNFSSNVLPITTYGRVVCTSSALPTFDNNFADIQVINGHVPAELISDYVDTEGSAVPATANSSGADIEAAATAGAPAARRLLTGFIKESASLPGSLQLNRGSLLLAPSKLTVVHTPFGEVKVDAGSVVLLMAHARGISVFNFDDLHRSAVELRVRDQKLALAPGRHATIGTESNFAELNPAQSIPHRNLRSIEHNGKVIFESEFSLPVAFEKVRAISKILGSKNPQARKMASHMIKTAAVLTQIKQAKGGVYQQYAKAPTTAFAQ